jgi:catecholate siderophore receptor
LRGHAGTRQQPNPAAGKDAKTATLVTAAALLTAAGSASMAIAQSTLPPVSVEATQAKPKVAKKKAPPVKAEPAPSTAEAPPKDASPYGDPKTPYKADKSGSGKLTQPLVDTPRSVTAVPRQVLEDKGVQSLRELARQTPGVTIGFGEGGNAFGDRFFIRGFDARGDTFVDGIRDPGNSSREIFAIEQVEIFKGPASSVGGRSTVGGAINMITKKANENENFYNYSQQFGTDGTARSVLDINQVVAPWLAVRGSFLYHQNEVADRDITEDERWGGFVTAAIKMSHDAKLTLDYYRYRTAGIPDFGVPMNKLTGLPWTESGVPRSNWYGDADRDFMKNAQDIVTATFEYNLSPAAKLTSKTRWGKTIVDYIATGPEDPDPNDGKVNTAGGSARYQETSLLAHQTDVTVKFDTFGLKHTAVAGFELSREQMSRFGYPGINQLAIGGAFQQDLWNPNHYPGAKRPDKTWTYDVTIDTQAVYLIDTVELSKQLFIHGGIRFDHFEREQIGAAATNTASRSDDFTTWNVGVVYKPLPIASIYAAYSTAVAPIGSELDATGPDYGGLNSAGAVLDPERAKSAEIGTKWELFDRRLLLTFALFQVEKENARELNSQTLGATGAYRIQGIELGVQGKVTDKLSLFGGLVLMDTEVTKSGAAISNVGRDLANVPELQFTLLAKYQLTDKFSIGGQAIYSAGVWGGMFAANDGNFPVAFQIPDHWRFDVMAEYKFTKNFSAQLNVVNITDELYYDTLYRSGNPFAFVAPGRAGYLTLNWKF